MRLKKYSISVVVLVLFSILTSDFANGQNPLFKVESGDYATIRNEY